MAEDAASVHELPNWSRRVQAKAAEVADCRVRSCAEWNGFKRIIFNNDDNEKPLARPVVVIDANSMKPLQMIKCAADKYERQQKCFYPIIGLSVS